MKIETLRTLIEDIIKNDNLMVVMPGDTIALQKKIMKVIDLYEEDNKESTPNPFIPTPGFRIDIPIQHGEPDEVPYNVVCRCNPENGGSGLCGCVMGNKMVPNPKKYGSFTSQGNWGTTTTDTITGYGKGTTFTNTPGNTSIKIKTTND
jgi:hypothetical protein